MSFINLMANDVWSETDITNRTEAMAHAVLSVSEEAILSRKIIAAMMGQWVMSPAELATQVAFSVALAEAHQAGIDARADMALLLSAMAYEGDNTIQASAETLALVALRNPVEADNGT